MQWVFPITYSKFSLAFSNFNFVNSSLARSTYLAPVQLSSYLYFINKKYINNCNSSWFKGNGQSLKDKKSFILSSTALVSILVKYGGCSLMAECGPVAPETGVRFPSSAFLKKRLE